MPDGQLPLGQPTAVDVDLMDLPEGGFGWFLIQDLARDVTYVRVGSENRLDMRLAVGLAASTLS
jgi:serine/threonine-protein kinase RsbW